MSYGHTVFYFEMIGLNLIPTDEANLHETAIFRVYWTDSYYDIDGSLVMVRLFFLPLPLLDS